MGGHVERRGRAVWRGGLHITIASPVAQRLQARAPELMNRSMTETDPKDLIRIAHEDGSDGTTQPLDLGARVRELRKAQDWTLEQAAKQAGLARSTLSKIENGQMSPTYEALKKLAVGLEISVPQLFTPPAAEKINGRMAVTKSGEGAALRQTIESLDLKGFIITLDALHCQKKQQGQS